MNKQYIAVIDSGIGGISVLKKLVKNFQNENFLYFGDNDNAPYGNRSKHNLLDLTIHNIEYINKYNLKMIVLACNTLSVNLIKEISEYSMVPVFGVFPAVEKCQMGGRKTLLLATQRTSEKYKSTTNFDSIGLYDLARLIEKNMFCLDKFSFKEYFTKLYPDEKYNKTGYYDNVILGCTHYNFIKKQIFDHFEPQNIIDGINNTINQISKKLKTSKPSVNIKENKLLFVGQNADINHKIYKKVVNDFKNCI